VGKATTVTESDDLAAGAREFGIVLAPSSVAALIAYLDLLYEWNPYAGFTTITRRDAVRLHLLDSLALLPSIGAARRIVDLGSGGGLPGIPVALALADTAVTLVESKRRRCSFLREAVRQLNLVNRVQVIEADVKGELASLIGPQEAVVARAFVPPTELLGWAARLLANGGVVTLMSGGAGVGEAISSDAAAFGFVLGDSRTFQLPGGMELRTIATFRKRPVDCFT